MSILEIDGSHLEGGGQILRTAVGLAAATGTPCRIYNIRKSRPNPGLAAQHLRGVQAVARLCDAHLSEVEVGSTELEFRPGGLDPPAELSVEVGTAGSVTLVLQGLLIPLSICGRQVEVSVSGGTHVRWSPPADYFQNVFGFFAERLGFGLKVLEVRPGFYPRGGGRLRVRVTAGELTSLRLTERRGGRLIYAHSIATRDLARANVAQRQLKGARSMLELDEEQFGYKESPSTGTAIHLCAEFENCRMGASALGERGKPAEKVGREAGREMLRWLGSGAPLDGHMADQILPHLALAGGESEVRVAEVTDHCRTSIWVTEQFLPVRFGVSEREGAHLIRCSPGA